MNIVIEVRGGVVDGVYSDMESLNVTLIDWDNIISTGKLTESDSTSLRNDIIANTPYSVVLAQ